MKGENREGVAGRETVRMLYDRLMRCTASKGMEEVRDSNLCAVRTYILGHDATLLEFTKDSASKACPEGIRNTLYHVQGFEHKPRCYLGPGVPHSLVES